MGHLSCVGEEREALSDILDSRRHVRVLNVGLVECQRGSHRRKCEGCRGRMRRADGGESAHFRRSRVEADDDAVRSDSAAGLEPISKKTINSGRLEWNADVRHSSSVTNRRRI
jgi:hypothetical protein